MRFRTGAIGYEKYILSIEHMSHFTPHNLRKYALTTFANNNTHLRIAALFEGHKTALQNDDSYIQISRDALRKAYLNSLDDLTFLSHAHELAESDLDIGPINLNEYIVDEIRDILADSFNEIKTIIDSNNLIAEEI